MFGAPPGAVFAVTLRPLRGEKSRVSSDFTVPVLTSRLSNDNNNPNAPKPATVSFHFPHHLPSDVRSSLRFALLDKPSVLHKTTCFRDNCGDGERVLLAELKGRTLYVGRLRLRLADGRTLRKDAVFHHLGVDEMVVVVCPSEVEVALSPMSGEKSRVSPNFRLVACDAHQLPRSFHCTFAFPALRPADRSRLSFGVLEKPSLLSPSHSVVPPSPTLLQTLPARPSPPLPDRCVASTSLPLHLLAGRVLYVGRLQCAEGDAPVGGAGCGEAEAEASEENGDGEGRPSSSNTNEYGKAFSDLGVDSVKLVVRLHTTPGSPSTPRRDLGASASARSDGQSEMDGSALLVVD